MKAAHPTAISELAKWPHWVCWKTVERDGKPTKVPFQPNGRPASSTDPTTWSGYEACAKALERFDGLGYVFAEDDEYFGVDLDHCVTDGVVHSEAMKIVERLGSYTEFSPSKTGLHIIARGRVNGKRNRTKKTPWEHDFEVYDQARFFTVTMDRSSFQIAATPETIESRQAELDAVCEQMFPAPEKNGKTMWPGFKAVGFESVAADTELMEKIRASKQGPKFADLYDCGASEGQESEADLALCNILAFWLGPDEPRIDAWFRRSALMREKWDDRRGDTTYGGYTIARALDGRTEFYGQKKTTPARKHDDPEMSYAEEISALFGLIDDPIVAGWRSSKKATAHVVFTTRSGAELELDSWKSATTSPAALAQEIGVQLGVEVTLKKEDIKRLNVLVGKFCELHAVMTVQDRARELAINFLQAAEELPVDLKDTADRWRAFNLLSDRDPVSYAKAENIPLAAACLVLRDASGKRYVRVQSFLDYVKAAAVAGTASAIVDHIETPGGWNRIQNKQGRMKATNPGTDEHIWQVLYEVPAGWGSDDGDSR